MGYRRCKAGSILWNGSANRVPPVARRSVDGDQLGSGPQQLAGKRVRGPLRLTFLACRLRSPTIAWFENVLCKMANESDTVSSVLPVILFVTGQIREPPRSQAPRHTACSACKVLRLVAGRWALSGCVGAYNNQWTSARHWLTVVPSCVEWFSLHRVTSSPPFTAVSYP